MKTRTRVLAWLICIVMLLGMFPGVTLAAEGEERVAGPVVVKDPDSPTGYTGQFTYFDAAAQQVYFCGDLNLSNYADQTDTKVYSPQEYKPGLVRRGGSQFKVPMENLGDGWWYYELPLAAGANQYWFNVDSGRRMMPDPANHPNWSPNSNQNSKDAYNCVYVPYDEKQGNEELKAREVELPRADQKGTWEYVPYELNGRTFYMGVYLPYGYDADRAEPYKTIYLIHGYGQDESDWMGIGSAPNIMDNLVAEGRTEAAVLVALPNNNNSIGSQNDRFAALFNTVLPFVEENYNVSKEAADRSVAGLSMGSRYSKYIMETDALSFGYYGLFSCSETVKMDTPNLDKAHIFIGLGVYDGANYQNATTTNTQNLADYFEKTVYVGGAHDFNTWSQLFRIYAEDYLWQPWAFGDGEEPEPETEKGLVLKYDFKSLENGTIVEDVSGHGKAAEVMPRGSGVQTREVEIYGQPKTAIVIAGGAPSEGHNYVELPVGVLNDLESVTISCWAYVNRTVSYGRIWDFGSNTTAYMYLLDGGGNTGHRGYTTALTGSGWSNEIGPQKGSNLATRTWKLTTVTFDGATREISLYEDGEKIGTSVAAIGLDRLYGSTQNWIGYGQFKDNMFNGMIADFRIYDYAMSEAEVAKMFEIPDSDRVQRDYNSLSLGNTQNLESNLRLPAAGAAGSSIEWTTSDPGVITAEGVITRPAPGQPNSAATLTARIYYGEAEQTKTFDVTVQAQPTDAERVAFDAAAIDLGSLSAVIDDLRLPTKGAKESDIVWTSSDPAHLGSDGKVTRPVGEPVSVKLTAEISYGEASETREFDVTILPVYEKLDAVKTEEVAVTTKAGIAPALPAMVLTTFEDGSKRMVKATWPTNYSGADFAEVGEKTVTGALVDFPLAVTAKVTVVEELPTPAAEAELLKLADVTLDGDDTIYAQNMGRALEYLKIMNADRMLYNFRRTFGQDTKGAQALSGWDEPTGLLRGHSTGHFMSALAEAYASTGDAAYKEKLDYMIDSMRELQLLSKGKASDFKTACTPSDAAQSKWSTDPETWGEGFISAYSPDQFALLEQYTPYATIWAPYYTMHKLLSGFLDSYVYAGNETGLQIAKDLGLWVYDRLSACTPEQRTKMWAMYIAGEYGGMNEVLARLYEITGDERLLTASRMFDNTVFFNGLAENKDTIQTRHANQHIPQIVGAIHEYAATGDPYYYNVARNFWEMTTARYAYSIGGVGTGESFKQPYRQGNNITGSSSRGENCETCAAYNMLKLTRDIYIYDPDNAEYMDYYERTVLNQIAASQSHNTTNSMHNGCTYMLPIDPGQRKTYDSDYGGFTCCNGTGMENHVIYQIAAYAKTDDTIYVNLFMPSTAEWEEKGITLRQETKFPSEDSRLTVSGSGSFKMKIRVPYWATAGFTVKVNGETVCTKPTPSSYVEIDRAWADGDVVDIHMPYTLHLDKTPDKVDGSLVASLMYGPIVMVAKDDRSRYTAMNWYNLSLNDTNLEDVVAIEEPAGTGNVPHLVVEGLDFYPMYDAYNYRYHAYVKLMDAESVLNTEYLRSAVDAVSDLTADNFSGEDWTAFQAALSAAQALLDKAPEVTQEELFDAQIALEEAAAKAGDEPEIPEDQKGLKDYFKDYFRIGTATEVGQVNSEQGREFMLKHFNSVTCENDMKPQHTLDQAGSQAAGDNVTVKVQLNDNARTILKFCEDNHIPMRGHVLCWHSQTPAWLFRENFDANGAIVSKEIMDQRLESYIKNYFELLATEFPNLEFYSFDVVNEAFTDDNPATMRTASNSPWISVYGDESFIYKAFELADKYKPEGCLLAYNDYNEYNDGKLEAIYALVKDLYEKGWLDAVGMQGHLTVPNNPSIERFRNALAKYATIGCKIMVTELDAQRGSGGDLEQAEYYQQLFETLVEYKDQIEAVVFWGNHDGVSWRRGSNPLLFDSNYQPKEAYYSVLDVLSDHEHEFERSVIEPTCTEEGQVIDTCTICGRTIVRERPKKLGHDWDEGVITTPPTEESTGVRTYTCKRCGETKTGRVPRIGATTPDDIDFTNPADADKFEVVNKATAEIESGTGLVLTPTADAFEPLSAMFGGGATESEPKDLIKVPVSGDWTATLKFDYDPNNVTFAFSTYFSFLAMEGDDYQNMAGIRATNSVAQDFLRKDGEIATPTISGGGFGQPAGPQTGFPAAGTYYYRMEKAGDSYTFYRGVAAQTRGPENVEFEEIFALEDTGIEAEYIVIDAYKTSTFSFGGDQSWLFTLKSLNFDEGEGGEQLKPGPNVVKDPESPTGYTVKFLYENPDAESVDFAGDIGLRNWADTSDETTYTPFEYRPGFMRAGSWRAPMEKREDGLWYIEVPLAAGANQYWFYVNGGNRMEPDPNNHPEWSPGSNWNTKNAYNAVYVPYDDKQDFEPMKARVAENPRDEGKGEWEYVPIAIGETTRYMGVYTPPGYDPEDGKTYKTIYAVHGGGQDESDWMGIGSVQNIMDNLVADGKTEPAFIVTPASRDFGTDFANLFGVMVAYMESHYKVSSDPQDRAFCGLSAGGGQTRTLINSTHADQFGYYGPWSSSNTNDGYAAAGDLSTAHIMFGVGYHDPIERRHATEATLNELRAKGAYVVNEVVAGAHDFNAWCQLFRIFCEKYLWNPAAFGDTGTPEITGSTYKITAPHAVKLNAAKADEGNGIVVTADDTIEKITVQTAAGEDVPVKKSGSTFTFTMPASDVQVKTYYAKTAISALQNVRQQGNPFIPIYDFNPDTEPHIWEDPDNPGQYRFYFLSSHDMDKNHYCSTNHVLYSCPVDDPFNWTYHGVIVGPENTEHNDILYAPDMCCVEDPSSPTGKYYYYYPCNQGSGRSTMVLRSSRPDGKGDPFTVINWADESHNRTAGSIMTFDPSVFVDDDGKVYGYWGGYNSSCHAAQLDETMYNAVPGTQIDDIFEGDGVRGPNFGFFEASSMRKIGDTYVFVYSTVGKSGDPASGNYNHLAYAYSKSPLGPFTYGGVIVNATAYGFYGGGNTHGSLIQLDGQWYITYHRNVETYARQAMISPVDITIEEDGTVKITEAEVTSEGFYINGLNPYAKVSLGTASYTRNCRIRPLYEDTVESLPIINVVQNTVVGVTYFDFNTEGPEGASSVLNVDLIPNGVNATMNVWVQSADVPDSQKRTFNTANATKIGEIQITADMAKEMTTLSVDTPYVDQLDGRYGVYFTFSDVSGSGNIAELYDMQFEFSDHGHELEETVVAPTCLDKGYTLGTCKICGKTFKYDYTDALGHDWDDGVVTVKPTATTPGVRTFTCRRCGETKTARIPRTGSSAPDDIDFTKADDAGKFELVNQAQSAIAEGEGLALIATRPAFEDCKGQNSGDQATIPEDVVKVPVSGDWTATLTVDFDTNGARNGYYQFFGFYAAQGEDYQNLAGIRGGDGAMQNFERHDGEITHQDEDGVNSAPGFASAGTYILRIEKEGDTYTCYRSEDGENFTEMFAYPESGIEADYIVIDAYTGMTEGYKFTLKSLEFEGGSVPMAWVLAETVEAGGQYVIVSNGYALTNRVAEVSTAYGRTSLASTPVTVENEIITSEVSEDMIWDFTAATSSSNNGFETGYVLTSGDSKYLSRNGPTNGNPAPLNTQTYDASNYDTKPQYCYWVVEDLDDAGNKAVFCTGTGEWSFALRGSAEGFDAPGNSSAATIVSQNPVQLYELIGKPVQPEEPEEPITHPELPIYENKYDYSFAERAADLLARMSLTQKGSMLVENSPAILAQNLGGGALNVPATQDISHYCWWSEALHGFLRDNEQPQTDGSRDNVSYAQSLTMASTWNPALYYEGAVLIADEIRERAVKNELGNCINLEFYSPTINMQRDPRWGRNEESYSEDPYLTAMMGSEFVFGMEGKDREGNMLDPNGYYKTLTTIKHYVANNTEAIRQSGGATSDLRALREYYAAPYRDIIQKADVSSVMTAYSSFNGEPCSYSSYLMDTLLRQTYGFSGFITSDCDSVSTMSNLAFVNPRTGEKLTAVEQWGGALAHGEDLECNSGGRSDYRRLTKDMVDNAVPTDKGIFTENTIDVSAHRLLTARISTGELDTENGWTIAADERKADQEARGINNYTPERIAVVDREVDEGVVMLKNDGILPLQIPASGEYKVVIIGEHQNSSYLGLYSSEQRHAVDDKWRIWIGPGIEQAILAKNPEATVTRIASNTISDEDAIRAADVVIVVAGTSNRYSAEGRDRSSIVLPDNQAQLISNVGKLNPNTVAVMETCGPMQVTQFENDVKAILWSSFGGIRKGVGFGHVLTGVVNPSGHLTSTWHQNDSDMPGIRDYNLYATDGSHGRTYMYYDNTVPVSYPFGYGLSYTTFEYSNLKIDKTAYDANETVKVTFDVKNTGSVTGKDVAQLYVAQPDAPAELLRPIRRLKGFDKFELEPGETRTVSLEVSIPDLAYYNEEKDQFEVDTGRYQVQVGEDSAHANLTADFTVSGVMDEYPVVLTAKPNQEGDTALGIEQRVIFDMGATIHPQLTVAMNNEKLYGYIIADQQDLVKSLSSTPLPEGMTFTMKSNRPSVARVQGDTVLAVKPGVATVTVTGEMNGHVVTTDFVVYVEASADVDSITVDGKPLEGFARDQYSYELDYSGEGLPVVAAISSNPDLEITVNQMTALPGVAEVISVSKSTGTTSTYRIGAGPAPVSTDFSEGWAAAQAKGWQVINPTANAAFGENGLTITTEPGALGADQKNLYYEPAFGSWVAQTHVSLDAPLSQDGPQIGLLAYDDDSNYINYCISQVTTTTWGRTTVSRVLRVYAVDNGEQTQVASVTLGEGLTDIWLQMVKRGKIYAFNYSLDGENWNAVSGTAVLKAVYPKLTVYASGSTLEGIDPKQATFDGINVFKVGDLYPRLSTIRADGEVIPGFDPETFVYNYEIDRDKTGVPVITAVAADPEHEIEITQMDKVTGMATVTITSGAATKEYLVSYNYAPASDYFADGSISDDWTILNEDPEGYSIEKGKGVVLPTQYGDIRAADAYTSSWKNAFVAPAMGIAWEIVAKVVFPVKPNANTQTNEFLIWQDDANYIYQGLSNPLRVTYGTEVDNVFTSNNSGWWFTGPSAVAAEDDSVTLYLSYKYSNGSYLLSWSQDGRSFQALTTVSNVNLANPMIGLFATERGTVEPVDVQYEYVAVTSLNTIEQMNYTEMLTWAAQNAANYIAADLPDETVEDLAFSPAPHGYTVSVASSDPAVIAADGTVTQPEQAKDVTVTVTVTEGDITASASRTVHVPGKGGGTDPSALEELYRIAREALERAQAAQARAEEALQKAQEAGAIDTEALAAAKEAAEAAQAAAQQAMIQATAAKEAAEAADRDAAAKAAAAARDAAAAAEQAAKAAQANAAAARAQAAAEAAQAAAEAAEAAAAADKTAVEAAKAAAKAAAEAAEAAKEAAHAADLDAAVQAGEAAMKAAESARAQAAAAAAQAAAEAAAAAAKAAQAEAEAAQANAAADAAAVAAAKAAAENAKTAAENARAAAEAAKTAAEGSNTEAAQAAAKAAEAAAQVADALAEVARTQADIAELKAAAEQSAADAAAALAAAEAAKAAAEAAELNAVKYQAKAQLANAAVNTDPAAKAAIQAILAAGEDAIDAAADKAAVQKAVNDALAALAALESAECPSKQYSDVPAKDNWAHAGIDYCVANELMNGVSETLFAPDVTTTRAQFATILYRAAGEPDVTYKGTFSDVPDKTWYSKAVEWAAAEGIVNGVGNGKFNPDGKITREQIAAILYRYSDSPKVEGTLSAFRDYANVSEYAVDAMNWAVQEGIITGVGSASGTLLQPQANATRAQIAAIFARFLSK